MSRRSEDRALIREYEAKGWTVTRTSKGNRSWRSPTGVVVIQSVASNDPRASKNHKSLLKRGARSSVSRYNVNQR